MPSLKARNAGVPMMTGTDAGFAVTPYSEWHAEKIGVLETDRFADFIAWIAHRARTSPFFRTRRAYVTCTSAGSALRCPSATTTRAR